MSLKTSKKLSELGYCCAYGYFLVNRNRPSSELAKELGISPRTVRWYKANIRAGVEVCLGKCQGTSSSDTAPGNADSTSH